MNTIKSYDTILLPNLTSRIRYACLMAAVLPLSVFAGYLTKGYVTDGLVVYWDAIDNAGYKGCCGLEYGPLLPPAESLETFKKIYMNK